MILLHQVVERRPADAEQLGRSADIIVGPGQRLVDGAPVGHLAGRAQIDGQRFAFPAVRAGKVEIGRTVEEFGNIVHAFSAYESKNTPQDPQPFARGINSIQLLRGPDRWYVLSIFWDSERADNPIPAKYLNK